MEVIISSGGITVPDWVSDRNSFRRWAVSNDFPEAGQLSQLQGKLWVDLSRERADHDPIKTEVVIVSARPPETRLDPRKRPGLSSFATRAMD